MGTVSDKSMPFACFTLLFLMGAAFAAYAQNQQLNVDINSSQTTNAAPLAVTLQDALARARKIDPQFRAALTEFGLAKEDRVQGRANLLPNVNYNAQFLYTEGNGTAAGRYVANNGVHEYISQGNVHQALSLADVAEYRRTQAAEAVARARSEIAARGLVVTVVQAYYGFVVAQRKYGTAQRADGEAQRFLDISQKLEHGGEQILVAFAGDYSASTDELGNHRKDDQGAKNGGHGRIEVGRIFPGAHSEKNHHEANGNGTDGGKEKIAFQAFYRGFTPR